MRIMIINGPNLNLLGVREKNIYGAMSYEDICAKMNNYGKELGCYIEIFQSNVEGEIINCIHKAYNEKFDGIIINPAAYTHYSIAIYDALKAANVPAIEVHLTNLHCREEFRKKSITAAACIGIISGFGDLSYILALKAMVDLVKSGKKPLTII